MEKQKMTHNEYVELTKKLANRVWSDKNYSLQQYNQDLDNIQILPYNLDIYKLPKDIQDSINKYFDNEVRQENDNLLLAGFSGSENIWFFITEKLQMKRISGYYYSGYCKNDDLKLIMTHTEGDLHLMICKDAEQYKKELEKTIKFYDEN